MKGELKQVSQHTDQHAQNNFFCKEKRWGLLSCYRSENSESVGTLYALQNGKFADLKYMMKERN